MLLNDVLKEFLFEIKIRNNTPRTQKGYKTIHYLSATKGRKPAYINAILTSINAGT